MRKDVKLRLLILATGLILMAAVFITACPDGGTPTVVDTTPAETSFTVTFMNGVDSVKTITGLKSGDTVTLLPNLPAIDYVPNNPIPTTPGFYKLSSGIAPTASSAGWSKTQGGTTAESSPFTVTSSQTLYAIWSDGNATWETTGLGTSGSSTLQKAVSGMTAGSTTLNCYALVLGGTETSGDYGTPMNSSTVNINQANTKLTITSSSKAQRTIKSQSVTTGVFLTIGGSTYTKNSISVTLNGIALRGMAINEGDNLNPDGTSSSDSLVRVQNGAKLIMRNASVKGHINSATSGNGTNGNGSAVCVYNGGELYIKDARISDNRSSQEPSDGNKNRVAGIGAFGGSKTVKGIIEIETGYISDNITGTKNASTGVWETDHTNDIYVTEFFDVILAKPFNPSQTLTVKDFTLNADGATTSDTTGPFDHAVIQIPSKITNGIKINLRSTKSTLPTVQGIWKNEIVLKGVDGYQLTSEDLGKITLGDFRGSAKFETGKSISPTYKLVLNGNEAKLEQ